MPEELGIPRFRLVIVVPITTERGMPWALNSPTLYPSFPAGTGGLSSASIALLDQVRAVDVSGIIKYRGPLTPNQYAIIEDGLPQLLTSVEKLAWMPARRIETL
jgi:mRNA interferase MazF